MSDLPASSSYPINKKIKELSDTVKGMVPDIIIASSIDQISRESIGILDSIGALLSNTVSLAYQLVEKEKDEDDEEDDRSETKEFINHCINEMTDDQVETIKQFVVENVLKE
jgi:hypothetical protein